MKARNSNPLCITFLLLLLSVIVEIANAQTVSVWLTTDDQVNKLQSVASVTFVTGSGGNNPVFVDETQTYQRVEGFGASLRIRRAIC